MLGGRIVAPGDPLWEQDDTDLALALTQIEADRCECGHPRSESMDPAHEFDWRAEFLRCHACAARDRAIRNTNESFDSAGVRWLTMKEGDDG